MAEIRNPNQAGGGGDSRTFLVMMFVMIAVIVGLQFYKQAHPTATVPPDRPSAAAAAAPGTMAATNAAPTAATGQAGQAPGPAVGQIAGQAAGQVPAIAASAETTTVVENELYKITFSNKGGEVRSWLLKKYKDATGQPLDLVHDEAAAQFGYPLSLYTYDAALTKALAAGLYVASATGPLQAPATLTFKYATGNLVVTKTFTFSESYLIHADTVVLRDGVPVRALLSWPAGLGDMDSVIAYNSANLDTSANGKDSHESLKKIGGGATLTGPYDFAGTSDQYFAALFLPDAPADASLVTFHNVIDVQKLKPGTSRGLSFGGGKSSGPVPVIGSAVGDLSGHNLLSVFVGPKSIDVLRGIHTASGDNLAPLIDFGFFGPIAKYLFLGLRAVHSILPDANLPAIVPHNFSWGWAIVLFTILINLVLLPLRIQGMRSMLKMARIQPQLDAIKARYKNPKATDPKMAEMNAEIMATQKANGVSMFGGCIPSLIQLPLLFAFFTMMTRVVELRQAHFFWLPDLSAADPFHILPVLMIITSFLVQFYTPTSPGMDPQQQKMMAFMMPAFSGFMTWNYASGLALYWNVGNLIMILQQAVMNNTTLGKEIKAINARRALAKTSAKAGSRPIAGSRGTAPPVKTIQGRR